MVERATSVPPALTAEEWAEVERAKAGDHNTAPLVYSQFLYFFGGEPLPPPLGRRDALAALCLDDLKFFTWEDVDRHRNSADHLQESLNAQGPEPTWDFPKEEMKSKAEHVAWHLSMADRIESLLPPREP